MAERLEGRVGADVVMTPLYGMLGQAEQDAAIRPATGGMRKVVLATSIAETSITRDGVRVVIELRLAAPSRLRTVDGYHPAGNGARVESLGGSAGRPCRANGTGNCDPPLA